jgi:hypothetical protein
MDFSSDEEGVQFELPDPPRFLPRPQPNWAAMSTSSTRFAVATLRKSTKSSLFKCKRLISGSKEADRLEAELDRLSRQTKNDMALAKVPKALLKDRRIAVLEDVNRTLEQMSKKLKISLFMERYLNNIKDERKTVISDLERQVEAAKNESGANPTSLYPSAFEVATRANRACPPTFSRPRATYQHGNRHQNASSIFLFNCRSVND